MPMTEPASDTSPAPDTFAVIQRRLVGLGVLLLMVFLLSLLLRGGARHHDALPSVVIPLNGGSVAVNPAEPASAAPTLDMPEPVAPPAPARADPAPTGLAPAAVAAKPAEVPPPSKPRAEKPVPLGKPAKPPAASSKQSSPRRWVVVGSYKDPMAAKAIAGRIERAGFKADSTTVTVAGERLNRVRAGPFVSKEQAESARVTLIVEGLTKAVTVVEK